MVNILRVVLFAEHLVSNKGHIAHAQQQLLIRFFEVLYAAFKYCVWVFDRRLLCGVFRYG